jgi:hypothetical protein
MTPREARGRALSMGAAALILAAACSPSPTARPIATARPTASAAVTVPPTASPRPTRPNATSVELHLLDVRYVPGDAPVSADGQVLWAAGEHTLSEVWRFIPGAKQPELVYTSPRREANVSSIIASNAGYAFVEESEPDFGKGAWRVWFLSAPGAQPVELARGVARLAGVSPFLAMSDDRVVWAGFDEPATGFVTRVQMAAVANPSHVTTLVERPVDESLIWYPTLHRNELWFSTIHPNSDPTAEGPKYNLEMLDLGHPAAGPIPFDGTGHDFNPAVNDDYLVWKANRRGDSALTWGTLKVLDRRSEKTWTIPGGDGNRPTIGDRFVAFDEMSPSSLPIYDPVTRTLLDLASATAFRQAGHLAFGGESLSGRLLAFSVGPADASTPPRLGWAILPE